MICKRWCPLRWKAGGKPAHFAKPKLLLEDEPGYRRLEVMAAHVALPRDGVLCWSFLEGELVVMGRIELPTCGL